MDVGIREEVGTKGGETSGRVGRGDDVNHDPPLEAAEREEREVLTLRARKHFRLFRSPFEDVRGEKDIFWSEDHYFIREMMLDAGRSHGFIAVVGEVGSGKSTIRRSIVQQFRQDTVQVIFPAIMDKRRVSASNLLEECVYDLSDETPKQSLTARTRQVIRLLQERGRAGMKQVLLLEESHLMNIHAFKILKQFHELEDGYRKLLGIILVGQPELGVYLDETRYPQLREVARRVVPARIEGLGGEDVARYIGHKFGSINCKAETVFADDAYPAIEKRLTFSERGSEIRRTYPLSINNLCARAMNYAAAIGEPSVTGELVLNS